MPARLAQLCRPRRAPDPRPQGLVACTGTTRCPHRLRCAHRIWRHSRAAASMLQWASSTMGLLRLRNRHATWRICLPSWRVAPRSFTIAKCNLYRLFVLAPFHLLDQSPPQHQNQVCRNSVLDYPKVAKQLPTGNPDELPPAIPASSEVVQKLPSVAPETEIRPQATNSG